MDAVAKRLALLTEGYCIVERVLDPVMLTEMRQVTDRLIDGMDADEARRQRSTGSLIAVTTDAALARLVTHPPALDAMSRMGFQDIRFSSGYVISKPPRSPALFWHFDWAGWDHPYGYGPIPAQMFLMYYLVDTSPANGCLRVIPRSHREENPFHQLLADAHSPDLSEARDLSRPEFQNRPDEVDVCVQAGDLVIGDSRLLHAAHPNVSDARRTVITLWYHPDFASMPDPVKGYVAGLAPDLAGTAWAQLPENTAQALDQLRPRYDGTAAPMPFCRTRLSPEAFFAQKRA